MWRLSATIFGVPARRVRDEEDSGPGPGGGGHRGGRRGTERLFRRPPRAHPFLVRRVLLRHPRQPGRCLPLRHRGHTDAPGRLRGASRRTARLLRGHRSRGVSRRHDGAAESGASAARRSDGARPPRPGPGRAPGRLSPRGAPVRRVARRRLRPQERLGRDRRRRRAPQSSRRVHHLHRVRVHAVARGRQHAPQRGLRRRRRSGRHLRTPRLRQPRGPLGVDGRAAGTRQRRPRDPAQLQWLRRLDVRGRAVRRQRDRRGLRGSAHAQRTAGRDHAGQGDVGDAPVPVAQRRVGGLRDLPLPDRPVGQVETARQLRARRLADRPRPRGAQRSESVPVRRRGRIGHAQRGIAIRRGELPGQGGRP